MVIISDIHGCFKTMLALLEQIPEEDKAKGICFAGDLIDRGPASAQVVQYAIDNNIHVVKGNHEDMFLAAVDDPSANSSIFLMNGGHNTMRSYQSYGDQKDVIKDKHIQYLKTLPVYLEFKDIKDVAGRHLLVSHSNMDMRALGLRKQKGEVAFEEYVMWNRDAATKPISGTFNCYGHTPQYEPRIRKTKANIDTGCCFTAYGYGKLTALVFPEMRIYQQENLDHEFLRPKILGSFENFGLEDV